MSLVELLKKDVRIQEGLTACINCGTCTAICPAAHFYNYDPRIIADTVQRGNEADILDLLESDTIWFCGECLSCKTRCPRNNTPGYIVQALRNLCIYLDEIDLEQITKEMDRVPCEKLVRRICWNSTGFLRSPGQRSGLRRLRDYAKRSSEVAKS